MSGLHERLASAVRAVRARIDRDAVAMGVVPAAAAIVATALFAVPNYVRAGSLRDETQRLEAVAGENIAQRNNLLRLESAVAAMRRECADRCPPPAAADERDALLASVTRATDGAGVRSQSIRTGSQAAHAEPICGKRLVRREVTVEMTGSFDAAFGVLDAAESTGRLVTPRIVEFASAAGADEQAILGTSAIRATFVFDEWSESTAAADARKATARQEKRG
jgi:Tfp pilus assembly protein PilO